MQFDENGWVVGAVAPMHVDEAWSLLSPEPDARMDGVRWAHQAERFFRARLTVLPDKRYPAGTLPLVDAAWAEVAPLTAARGSRVVIVTLPLARAGDVRRAADLGVAAIGGAGMDALVVRARRLWQVSAEPAGDGAEDADPRAPLVVAAVLASLLLAPIVPPGGGTIFGVKGARERLAREGWKA
jgi:hypothetical protein